MCINCRLAEAIGQLTASPAAAPSATPLPRLYKVDRRWFLERSLAGATLAALPVPAFAAGQRAATTGEVDDGPPGMIFRGGKIYTQAVDKPWAEAVAVRGKKILAVGSNDEIGKLAAADTRVVDLGGKLMLPGFVEGHIHPFLGGFLAAGADLQVPTRKDALAAIAEYAKRNPTGPVRGFGWRVDMFPPEGPSAADLDAIIPDRPAFFFSIDAHSLWVNSKALEMAGVTRDTPDPIPGFSYYARNADGQATGYVLEVVAVLSVVNAVSPISAAAMGTMLEDWLPKAAAAGITTVFDAGVPPIGDDQGQLIQIYADLDKRGMLPFRVRASYAVKGPPVDGAAQHVLDLKARINTEMVQVNVLKIVGDGTQEGYTAWLLQPYADRAGDIGASPFSIDQWNAMVSEADLAGIDIHVHACGERTARVALDAIEAAMLANPKRERRNAIAHLVYVDDADLPRFGRLGVVAQYSANWMSADPDTSEILLARYGRDRQSRLYRPRTTLMKGGRISFGTDWPAAGYFSTYKPLDSIQIAVTRQLIGQPHAPVLEPASERLDLAQAVHANTMGAAYQLRMEDSVGSIEAGKLADLVVLEQNIFDADPHTIAGTKIEMTMMNGRITHGAVS
jgi:predicted amidohydrolase YtcJ